MSAPPRHRVSREQRAAAPRRLAADHGGVAHRRDLRAAGVSRDDVRTEVAAGRWTPAGTHTVIIGTASRRRGARWRAVWESGAGAVLDGVSALHAAGLSGFTSPTIDVTRADGESTQAGAPGCGPPGGERSDRWSVPASRGSSPSSRLCGGRCAALRPRRARPVSRRPAAAGRPGPTRRGVGTVRRSRRRALLDAVIPDVCDGAHSLGGARLRRMCRRAGLPPPTRQACGPGPEGGSTSTSPGRTSGWWWRSTVGTTRWR